MMSKDQKPQSKDASIYDEYIKGASIQVLADKYELDTQEVLAIIEGKQGAK